MVSSSSTKRILLLSFIIYHFDPTIKNPEAGAMTLLTAGSHEEYRPDGSIL